MNDLATTEIIITEKACIRCGSMKPFRSRCRVCMSVKNKKYQQNHKAEIAVRKKQKYRDNPEQAKERWKKYSQGNREKINAQHRKYCSENPEKYRESLLKYKEANIEKSRESCRRWAKNNPEKIRVHWAETGKRKRAAKKNAVVEKFNTAEIFKRDGWICQLCHKKVNPRLKHPHPLSKSLDHIVPLSRGGEHSRRNTQLAHLSCNVDIKAGGIKQLRLIG